MMNPVGLNIMHFFLFQKKIFEKEYVTVDINLLTNIIKNKKAQYSDDVILK